MKTDLYKVYLIREEIELLKYFVENQIKGIDSSNKNDQKKFSSDRIIYLELLKTLTLAKLSIL